MNRRGVIDVSSVLKAEAFRKHGEALSLDRGRLMKQRVRAEVNTTPLHAASTASEMSIRRR